MDKLGSLRKGFESTFGGTCRIYRAPGRVNLIGEHTDYNEGYVLPAALDFSCWVAAGPRNDGRIAIFSENVGERVEADLRDSRLAPSGRWSDYPIGASWALREDGCAMPGANLYFRGEVPLGAGLSSSAAIEVATAYALLEIAHEKIDLRKLAQICQRGETEFVGAHVGIMDQFVACHGKAGNALLLDCRSLEFQYVPLPETVRLVICNSMVRHELAAGEYNARRAECEQGVQMLSVKLPSIRSLRDVTLGALKKYQNAMPEKSYRRCRHVAGENDRVLETVRALRTGDLTRVGELMFASHESLRDDYEVSCKELDGLVEMARNQPGLIGARMTGGGFGGCTVNLLKREFVEQFKASVAASYHAEFGVVPEIYQSGTANGVERVS